MSWWIQTKFNAYYLFIQEDAFSFVSKVLSLLGALQLKMATLTKVYVYAYWIIRKFRSYCNYNCRLENQLCEIYNSSGWIPRMDMSRLYTARAIWYTEYTSPRVDSTVYQFDVCSCVQLYFWYKVKVCKLGAICRLTSHYVGVLFELRVNYIARRVEQQHPRQSAHSFLPNIQLIPTHISRKTQRQMTGLWWSQHRQCIR